MKFKKTAALLSVTALMLASACTTPTDTPTNGGTQGATDTPGEAGGDITMTILPKNLGNPYFETSTKGAQAAADKLGIKTELVGPAEAAADAQVQYIETATQQKVSAIQISANDQTALCDSIEAARAAGIKVVTFDSDAPTCRDLFINQATSEGIAKTLTEMAVEQAGGSGEIAILSATANATNQNAWIEAMKADLEANHPDITLVDVVFGDDQDQKSFDETASLIQKYPNLKVIVAPTTVGIAAAARYVSTSDAKGRVLVTGLGTPNDMRSYIADGTTTEFALWNPEELGYLTTFAAAALVEGTITGAEGDTFDAGDLGEYTVGADATVLLGDPYRFNADNIDDFNF
ncbi:MAG TPA: rhamnose ABC transporter substrate-binding protein [Arachnia sp.]|nr:rhamnose ABC transporter substrate-binding protein [Arachnia sp.]HMT87001.1 rhamnose ABC transporter substrate-binding protein [Arachnia sp.]